MAGAAHRRRPNEAVFRGRPRLRIGDLDRAGRRQDVDQRLVVEALGEVQRRAMTVLDEKGNKLIEPQISNIVKSIETIWPGMSHDNQHTMREKNRENASTRLRHLGVSLVDATGTVSDAEQYIFSLLDDIDLYKLAETVSRHRRLIEEYLHCSLLYSPIKTFEV